jgi:hypothetical protein
VAVIMLGSKREERMTLDSCPFLDGYAGILNTRQSSLFSSTRSLVSLRRSVGFLVLLPKINDADKDSCQPSPTYTTSSRS